MAIPDKPEESGKSAVPEIYSLSLTLLSYPQLLPKKPKNPDLPSENLLVLPWRFVSKKLRRDLRSPDSSAYFLGFINSKSPRRD